MADPNCAGTSGLNREEGELQQGEEGNSTCLVKLRVAGAWAGYVQAPLDTWTVSDLRLHLAGLSGFSPDSINLICAGKVLKDAPSATLSQLGLGGKSKLLITKVAAPQVTQALLAEEERHARLTRIKTAALSMVQRIDGNPFSEDRFDIQLENQSGVQVTGHSENDRRALIYGLMIHSKARDYLQHNNYVESLEVLGMAEEAFALCDSKLLEAVDNVAFLQIDVVWCYFMLKDIAKLADAGKRLLQAREGLRRSHGSRLERLRTLQGGFCPELAVYVRLELLEGVVAFHTGQFEAARSSLLSAQSKYNQLQVADEPLAFLAEMGFSAKEAQRALRVSKQDLNSAIEFAMDEKNRKLKRREEDRELDKQRREQKRYGTTAAGQPVDLTKLENLSSIGYEKYLAAEALRQTDNNMEDALDILTDPLRNGALQCTLASSQQQRRRKRVDSRDLEEFVAMGFQKEQAIQALENSRDRDQALEQLLQGGVAEAAAGPCSENSSAPSGSNENNKSNIELKHETRDLEMEEDIAMTLSGDPLAEYDIDVQEEGKALLEYISMINATIGS